MAKLLTVIRREFWYNLTRPSFLFTAFGAPVMVVGIIALFGLFGGDHDITLEEYGVIGYVDRSANGVLSAGIPLPESPDAFRPFDSVDAARAALDAGEIAAFFEVTRPYMIDGRINLHAYERVPDSIRAEIQRFMLANLSAGIETGVPLDRLARSVTDLTVRSIDTGREVNQSGLTILLLFPVFFAFLLVTASLTTSSFLMYGLVEERQNRVIEMIVTSVTPIQLLAGKVIGLGLLGLLQVVFLLVCAYIGIAIAIAADLLTGVIIPADVVALSLVYFLLSYVVLASALAALGVLVGSEQESRQYSGFIILPFMIPYFGLFLFLSDPNGTVPVALSIIPITSPMAMMMRLGLTNVPPVEIAASLGLMALTTLLFVWGSARVFRWGVLLYGKRFSPRALIRALTRRGGRNEDAMQTSAPRAIEETGR